jgi:hypothetical protein
MNNRRAKAKSFLAMSDVESKAEAVSDLQAEVKALKEKLSAIANAPVETLPNPDVAAMIAQGIETAMAGMAPVKKKRTRRSPEQMAAARAEEQAKKE